MKNFAILLFCNILPLLCKSQSITGSIADALTGKPIPFVSIFYYKDDRRLGTVSDKDGLFTINTAGVDSLRFSSVGYREKTVKASPALYILLERNTSALNDVVVSKRYNPAIRIIQATLKNKKNNDYQNRPYQYNCYFKTKVSFPPLKGTSAPDSVYEKILKQHAEDVVFISESYYHLQQKGSIKEKTLLASKTSGLKTPMVNQFFVSGFQSAIPIYANDIYIFENGSAKDKAMTAYLGPLANNCLEKYDYKLKERLLEGNDTVFVIYFEPKKGKNFKGLSGTIYIHSGSFAVSDIIANPTDESTFNFRFRQEFLQESQLWQPYKLSAKLEVGKLNVGKDIYMVPTYSFNALISGFTFGNFTFNKNTNALSGLNNDSIKISESIIERTRPEELTMQEVMSYRKIDSVAKKANIEGTVETLPKLATGRIQAGPVDVDITRLTLGNDYEKRRWGLGLYTNEKISKKISIGGYFGYGTGDKEWKYGASITAFLNSNKTTTLRAGYDNDLFETGSTATSVFLTNKIKNYIRNIIAYRFNKSEQFTIAGGKRLGREWYAELAAFSRKVYPKYSYTYNSTSATMFANDELSIYLRWANNEKFITLLGQNISSNTANPIAELSYKLGIPIVNKESFTYNKIEASINWIFYKNTFGTSTAKLSAGYLDSKLPYSLLFTGEGSNNKRFPYLVNNTFQTLTPYEFLSDKYAHLFLTHDFGSLLFKPKIKFSQPKLFLATNLGIGNLNNDKTTGIDYKINNHLFAESGLIIRQVLRLKFMSIAYIGFGGGAFRRYGYYTLPADKDNWAYKLSVDFSF